MIGVPALWQAFHRRIKARVRASGPAGKLAFDTLTGVNRFLRKNLGVNVGPLVFKPVFDRFGGKIRYFISGGASLPPSVFNTFHGLGFTLLEGYGLTETSPVLTVNRPGRTKAGSVGKALPGVEIDIVDPDGDGVGEIRARGPNLMRGYFDDPERTDQVIRDGWFYTGDLGRVDRKGRLYIVGRQKDVIVSSSGKNVYPDELEETFKHPLIDEMGVVGLPDGSGSERVAALVRPDYDKADTRDHDAVQQEIRQHIEVENARLPFHQRIKVVRFTDAELPRTATRKVKRDLVRNRLLELDDARAGRARNSVRDASAAWLFELLADIGSTDAEVISLDDQLIADLGFDSLMLTELASRVEDRTGTELDMEALGSSATVGDVYAASGQPDSRSERARRRAEADDAVIVDELESDEVSRRALPSLPEDDPTGLLPSLRLLRRDRDGDIEIPDFLAQPGSDLLDVAQKAIYEKGFNVKVYGRANVPYNRPVIVAANHSSHLDMGLVKYALWDFAPNLSALAASDYFFSTPARKAYFSHFTNLIPVERSGSLQESLANASRALEEGRQLIIFPEGTRSTTGEIQPFRRGLGYLAVRHECDVLPVYVRGTYRALPKGKIVPRSRRLEVHIGEPLTAEWLADQTKDDSRGEAYRKVSELTREAVLALKAGRRFLDAFEGSGDGEIDSGNPMLRACFARLQEEGRFVENAVETTVTYYFSLEESEDGKWTLTMGPESFEVKRGKPSGRADCVLKCEPQMFQRIVMEGYTPAVDEFMNGTVKTNDPNLLMAWQRAFAL